MICSVAGFTTAIEPEPATAAPSIQCWVKRVRGSVIDSTLRVVTLRYGATRCLRLQPPSTGSPAMADFTPTTTVACLARRTLRLPLRTWATSRRYPSPHERRPKPPRATPPDLRRAARWVARRGRGMVRGRRGTPQHIAWGAEGRRTTTTATSMSSPTSAARSSRCAWKYHTRRSPVTTQRCRTCLDTTLDTIRTLVEEQVRRHDLIPARPAPPGAGARGGRAVPARVVAILLLAVVVGLRCGRTGHPHRCPPSAPTEFSADRAMPIVDDLARNPSRRAARRRARVRDDARRPAAGPRPACRGSSPASSAGWPWRNVVATLPGTAPTGTVVLAAHTDSVAAGPGAADDALVGGRDPRDGAGRCGRAPRCATTSRCC